MKRRLQGPPPFCNFRSMIADIIYGSCTRPRFTSQATFLTADSDQVTLRHTEWLLTAAPFRV
jgi:hypothetical protein